MTDTLAAHIPSGWRRRKGVALACLLSLAVGSVAWSEDAEMSEEETTEKRRATLEQLRSILPPDEPRRGAVTPRDATWGDWLARTGELPPDFDALPSLPFLPDPLVLDEGGADIPVTTPEQWREKRRWMAAEIKRWITGTFPPPPDNLEATVLEEQRDGEVTLRTVELRFGPERRAKLTIELLIPPGEGPFPVFMTQWYHRGWALVALRRGYIGCVYAGADRNDDTEDYAEIWQDDHDFTRLMRRAWGAMRAIDYLETLPVVDRGKIAITGHSRNGKQSLMAAAFDERIAAVIPSSGGTGSEDPYRYTSEKFNYESIDEITRHFPHWLHPRLRFFVGREHKLPVDQTSLMALVAPRGLMLTSAITESQGNPWGIEQAYRSARRVYDFLDAEENLAIRLRHGQHAVSARDIEAFVDFFDAVFGRANIDPPKTLYYDYTFEKWKALSGERVDPASYPAHALNEPRLDGEEPSIEAWELKKRDVRKRIRWALGEEPPGATNPGPGTMEQMRSGGDDYLGDVIGRPSETRAMGRRVIGPYKSFGDYLHGNLYYPHDEKGKMKSGPLPVVIYLHEFSYQAGFARRSRSFIEELTRRGAAVFAFDMIGFGTRIQEGTLFYERYPRWSKLGRMTADVHAAVTALRNLDFVDPERIYAAGYSLGGTVGLYAAALDERIAGVASVCGFTPMRAPSTGRDNEGLQAYSHLHGLLPRLGFFVGHEDRTPYDFHEILASVAPRPALVVAPTLDRDADFSAVQARVEQARGVYDLYGRPERLTFEAPEDYNRFPSATQDLVANWIAGVLNELPAPSRRNTAETAVPHPQP
jgi:cephalosporin-C deacetylase-like acetyl esterase